VLPLTLKYKIHDRARDRKRAIADEAEAACSSSRFKNLVSLRGAQRRSNLGGTAQSARDCCASLAMTANGRVAVPGYCAELLERQARCYSTATASISIRNSGWARAATATRVCAGI